jgi:hypothetical protein
MTRCADTSARLGRRTTVSVAAIVVLLVAACGGTSATDREPASSTTTTTSARRDIEDDRTAINQVVAVLRAAVDIGFDNIRTLQLDGVYITPADQPSSESHTVSLATYHTQTTYDVGLAIRSNSGKCLWFAVVGGEERYGVGEPCTGVSALHESKHDLPNDSVWRLVIVSDAQPSDPQELYEFHAQIAQTALENALAAAGIYYIWGDFTLSDLTVDELHELEPSLTFVERSASTDVSTVSIAVQADRFGAAVQGANGTCYWITQNVGISLTQYGQGTPCTGTAALGATGDRWATVS